MEIVIYLEIPTIFCIGGQISTFGRLKYIQLSHQYTKKGKGRLWVLQHCCIEAYCTLTRMSSFIHLQRRCTHQAA